MYIALALALHIYSDGLAPLQINNLNLESFSRGCCCEQEAKIARTEPHAGLTYLTFILTGTQLYKVNEVGNRPIHGHFCGNHIMEAYDSMCYSGKRKRSKLSQIILFNIVYRTQNSSRPSWLKSDDIP